MDEWDQFPDASTDQSDPWADFPDADTSTAQLPQTPNSVAERKVSLPLPRPNMFASMSDSDAQMTYDAYRRHPDTQQDEDGNLIYKGQIVPPPEGNSGIADAFATAGQIIFSGMSPETAKARRKVLGENPEELDTSENIGRAVGGGAVNLGRNIVETGVAAVTPPELPKFFEGTAADKAMTDFRSGVTEGLEDTLPKFNPEGMTQHAVSTGTEIAGGLVLGNKALAAAKAAGLGEQAIFQMKGQIGRAVSFLTKKFVEGVVTGAPVAATVDDNSDTLVTGENAMIPILDGVDTNSPDEMNNVINRRMNIMIDAAVTALPIEVAADRGKKFLKFAYKTFYEPIKASVSQTKQSELIIRDIMDAVGTAADSADPNSEVAQAAKQRVVDIMQTPEFQEFYAKSGKEGVDDLSFRRDTASAIEAGLADDASEGADATRSVFNEYRKRAIEDAKSSGFRDTAGATERPAKAADKLFQQSQDVFGGDDGMDIARAGVQQEARKEIAQADELAADAGVNARRAETELPDKLREGPMGEAITEAEVNPLGAQRQRRNDVANQILEAEETGSTTIRETSKAHWKNIPEGLAADAEGFVDTVANIPDEQMTPAIKRALKKVGLDFDALNGVDPDDPEALDDAIGEMSLDFKQLQGLRKTLSDEITRLKSGPTPQYTKDLENLRKHITEDQSDFIIENAGEEGVEGANALRTAREYDISTKGPVTNQGLPEELRKIRENPTDRFNHAKRGDKARKALHETLTSDQPLTSSHFANTLAREEYGASHPLIIKYAMADAADKLSRKIKSGEGLTSIKPDDILQTLEPYRQVLNSNPELFGQHLDEFNSFYEGLVRNKNDVKKLQELAKQHADDAQKLKEDIFNVRLKEFFEKNGDPKPDGFAALRELYMNPQATGKTEMGRLDNVIRLAKASGDPMVLDGMKAAWMKLVRDSVFQSSENAAGKALSIAKTEDFLRGTGKANLRTVGQKLFEGDDAVILQAIDDILKPAMDVAISSKSGASKVAKGSLVNDAKEAVGAGVRLWKGPLTREGTQINTAFSKILSYVIKNDKRAAALDSIMADPDGFMKAYKTYLKAETPSGEKGRELFKWLVYSNVYNEGDWNQFNREKKRAEQEAQTQEVFNK